eukprot:7836888-Lingulodinium_polyedra.AAC.1
MASASTAVTMPGLASARYKARCRSNHTAIVGQRHYQVIVTVILGAVAIKVVVAIAIAIAVAAGIIFATGPPRRNLHHWHPHLAVAFPR